MTGPNAIATPTVTPGNGMPRKDFSGPPAQYEPPLTAWEQFAQALLLSNEFLFVD
jgi:hypothetical protein